LQKVELVIANQTYCESYHAERFITDVSIVDTQLCATGKEGEEKDTCQV
jgi:hypothetical protein